MLLYPTAANRYINESGTQRTRSSRAACASTLRRLQAAHPDWSIDRFDTESLTSYCYAGSPAPNTIRVRRAVLKGFFEWCSFMKIVRANPAADLKFTVRPSNQGVREHYWLSEQEVAHVLRTTPDGTLGRRDRLILMAGFMMGMRRDEIASLRWSQFSHDLRTLTFVGKGQKLAFLGVPEQFRTELAAWRSTAPAGTDTVLPYMANNWSEDQTPKWENPIGQGGITYCVANAVKRSGVMFRPHDMRRTFAGILEEKGVDIKDISRLLRHSNVGITSTYLEKNPRKTAALGHSFSLAL